MNTLTGEALTTSHRIIVASSDALRRPVPDFVIFTLVTADL
jgi:hypothetical protein